MKQATLELVSARSVRALDAAARAIGIELDLAALAPSLRTGDETQLIPVSEQIAYCRALANHESETLGLDLARHLPLDVTGLWGFLLRSSPTFGEMLRRAERYIRIVNIHPEFSLKERGGCAVLESHHPRESPYGNRPQIVMVTLGHWIEWGRQLTGVKFALTDARFRWKGPRDRRPFDDYFGCRAEFGAAEDALFLPKETLELRLRESAPELARSFEEMAAALIARMTAAPSFVDQARAALGEELLTGNGHADGVARRLALGVRTLDRRLRESGTTFRQLKDDLLRERAERLIRRPDVSLAEVAYLLGFSEPANFTRACRRWTGSAPSVWRRNVLGAAVMRAD